MVTPDGLKYSKDHEWVRVTGDKARVGITDHAQKQLGDVVYVELPNKGDRFEASEPFGTVESVKAASEVYVPLSGSVTAVNEALHDEPESVNTDPYDDGWMIEIKLTDTSQLDSLLTAAEYEDYIKAESAE
ncbi:MULTISPECIES: glycine cleavage system protein GcvH [Streptomyces]|uniref:Glycine cleavage system H protein n=1 Tax=Streptomyces cadmiisoli TaxID=2184053 RepID=A0A2Z4JAQ3_9ACTN|nr:MULTISPECIES: glycine cleavage system protein GcvH [Streptomyces]AWW41453.1 glycine cleavage system protein GcvH [Streptomyces cadmiisoli]KOV74864.1 glycine cleavage system protein H [Streptomyces sp. AS58]